jgi:RES domain-containing protein
MPNAAAPVPSLWRISQYVDLTGEGGRKADNHWNRRGRPVVYLGQSVPGVLLERLVHLMDNTRLPEDLKLIHIEYTEAMECAGGRSTR